MLPVTTPLAFSAPSKSPLMMDSCLAATCHASFSPGAPKLPCSCAVFCASAKVASIPLMCCASASSLPLPDKGCLNSVLGLIVKPAATCHAGDNWPLASMTAFKSAAGKSPNADGSKCCALALALNGRWSFRLAWPVRSMLPFFASRRACWICSSASASVACRSRRRPFCASAADSVSLSVALVSVMSPAMSVLFMPPLTPFKSKRSVCSLNAALAMPASGARLHVPISVELAGRTEIERDAADGGGGQRAADAAAEAFQRHAMLVQRAGLALIEQREGGGDFPVRRDGGGDVHAHVGLWPAIVEVGGIDATSLDVGRAQNDGIERRQ